jgi:hypothetical protein
MNNVVFGALGKSDQMFLVVMLVFVVIIAAVVALAVFAYKRVRKGVIKEIASK